MAFKIHPGIGLGRAGDSPNDWFIAPETSDAPPVPPGGYRDAEGLLKRAGARFRVFDHTASGFVELTAPEWEIEWTVVLRKGGVAAAAAIATGPNQTVDVPVIPFSSPAEVSLGQLRTDGEGRLVILSGVVAGTDFDARCEGRVTARVRHPGDPWDPNVVDSWVLLTAPDFIPQQRDQISAYDRMLESWRHFGLFSAAELAAQPSTRADVYPILRAHNQSLPFTEEPPVPASDYSGTEQDPASTSGAIGYTVYQATILNRWKDDDAIPDMPTMIGEPEPLPLTPQELDRGPLTHAAGHGFWDVDWAGAYADYAPTLLFSEPLRFDPTLPDATLAGKLLPAILWTNDYGSCSDFWPQHVPEFPYFEGSWHVQGFQIIEAGALVYKESNADPYILQLTHSIDFGVVNPAIDGPGWTSASIVFEVGSTGTDLIQFNLTLPLPPQIVPVTLSADVSDVPLGEVKTVRLWVAYLSGADIPPDTIVGVTDNQGHSYTVAVQGSTGSPQTNKLALVLDVSLSMNELRGDGASKLTGLKQAVNVLLMLADDNSGVGVAPFSTNALPTQPVLTLGEVQPDTLTGRETVANFVNDLDTDDATSIGDGLESGRILLADAGDYDYEALLVVTDGKENRDKYIHEVSSSIDARTFAIGIGTSSNVNVSTLQTLTGNLGGYLLLTGPTATDDNGLLLNKYFVQILSGVQNHQLIVDPVEHVLPETVSRIPFPVTETENSFTAVVVSDAVDRLQIALETPEGDILSPAVVSATSGGKYIEGNRVRAFRIGLPLFVNPTTSYFAGQWFLLVATTSGGAGKANRKPAIPCCVAVSANSSLELDAALQQDGVKLGSKCVLQASLDWYGVPFPGKAHLVAEVSGPTGSFELPLAATSPGRFAAEFVPQRIGDYGVRLRARGLSPRQFPFLREFTGSLAILRDEFEGSPKDPCPDDSARKCLRSLKHRLAERLCSLGRRLKDDK